MVDKYRRMNTEKKREMRNKTNHQLQLVEENNKNSITVSTVL
jgi:hypothetical protein